MALLALLWVAVYWWWEPDRGGPVIDVADPVVVVPDEPELPTPQGSDSDGPLVIQTPFQPDADMTLGASPRPTDPLPAEAPVIAQEPEPASAGTPVLPPTFRPYVIRPGDTFERIARRELGSASLAGAIARANAFVDPLRLRVGREIRIPVDPDNIQGRAEGEPVTQPAESAPMEYVVRRGDTLSAIASRIYGSSAAAERIYEANRDQLASPDDVRVGQTLRLPPKPAED
ncbi:MAG: LysM peptidoglycan-binding domain-containing protein [Planctomycetota bacterium]